MKDRRQDALDYLAERTGTLEYRFQRYAAVADELFARGMDDSSLLADLGAGGCDFDFYLRAVRGWKGRYLPVDASIDGTDLEQLGWTYPIGGTDFTVAIELLEHISTPSSLLDDMLLAAPVVVITTPNTDVLGEEYVRAIDRTHVRPIWESELRDWGATEIKARSFFGKERDSLLAVWER